MCAALPSSVDKEATRPLLLNAVAARCKVWVWPNISSSSSADSDEQMAGIGSDQEPSFVNLEEKSGLL